MPVAEDAAAHEREAARELRASQWWKNQIAAGKCHYCGGMFKPSELTMDHVIPVARGGKSDRHNVVPCCKACNNAKKARMAVEDILDSLP
ncbi:MAG: HNH endonuclease [Kiritimatiellae bacterium]|nr:HNH endonuclease [Kiritimatiellia bacterium]